jgi:hypothetical protein
MRSALLLSASLLLTSILQVGENAAQSERLVKMPPWLALVPEMMPIEGMRFGTMPPEDTIAQQVKDARTDLEKKRPEIEKYVPPEIVVSLSRWAKSQMKGYHKVPSLAKVTWKPVGSDDKGRLVLEGTVDTLPTHSPLVTRWLKVYLVFDGKTKEVLRVIVTIRGELLE